LLRAVENVEDSEEGGAADAASVTGRDIVIGLAASGSTPYVAGALRAARAVGATTALVTSNPSAPLAPLADIVIAADTGPEVIAGSTRLKAGTAQKLILNMLSTATMIRLGYVTGNRMTNLLPRNSKLRARSLRIFGAETGLGEGEAGAALDRAGGDLPTALVMFKTGRGREDAERALAAAKGVVARAVESLTAGG
ncbi:MAG: N-acetylmuramic acid 6-phosphate etherase, partial [Pyrinomonadaceae bacterium]